MNSETKKRRMPAADVDTTNKRSTRQALLDLTRLVHVMMHANNNYSQYSVRDLQLRAELVQSLWKQVADLEEAQSLRPRVEHVCRQTAVYLETQQAQTSSPSAAEQAVERLFVQPKQQQQQQAVSSSSSRTSRRSRKVVVDDDDSQEEEASASSSDGIMATTPVRPVPSNNSATTPNIADLQATQRQQLETAISEMAKTLKDETSRIHATLAQQTRELDEMEVLATTNVEAVQQVAQDVKSNVQRGWKRSIGTWTMIFTMVGAGLFSVLTILTVPKRPDACLFWNCKRQQEQFCRVVNGVRECIVAPPLQPEQDAGAQKQQHQQEEVVDGGDCEMDMYGECIVTDEAEKIRQAVLREYMENYEATKDHEDEDEDDGDALDDDILPDMQSAEEIRQAILREYQENVEATGDFNDDNEGDDDIVFGKDKVVENVAGDDEEDAFGVFDDDHVTPDDKVEKVPIYNGRPFSARDVRKAAASGDVMLLQEYIKRMPDFVDETDINGWTSLHLAVRAGHVEAVESLLVEGEANVFLETSTGLTALDIAKQRHGDSHPLTRLLEEYSTEGGEKGDWVEDDDDMESETVDEDELADEDLSLMDLHRAVAHDDTNRVLVYGKIMPELLCMDDENYWNALHIAAQAGSTESLKILLDAGCDPRMKNNFGQTPLDLAIRGLGDDHPIVHALQA